MILYLSFCFGVVMWELGAESWERERDRERERERGPFDLAIRRGDRGGQREREGREIDRYIDR